MCEFIELFYREGWYLTAGSGAVAAIFGGLFLVHVGICDEKATRHGNRFLGALPVALIWPVVKVIFSGIWG